MAKQSDGNDLSLCIYNDIQRRILSVEFEPGSVIPDSWFSDNYRASRTPIRTAMSRLEHAGYVFRQSGKWRVSLINADTILQYMYARVAIETSVIVDFMREGDLYLLEDLAHILRKQRIIASVDPVDALAFHEQDVAYHETWYSSEHKLGLWRLFRDNLDYARLKILDYKRKQEYGTIISEHEEILRCIQAKDEDRLKAILKIHIYDHIASLVGQVRSQKEYFV